MMNVGTNDREHPNSSPISSPSPRQLHGAPFLNDGFGKQASCHLLIASYELFKVLEPLCSIRRGQPVCGKGEQGMVTFN